MIGRIRKGVVKLMDKIRHTIEALSNIKLSERIKSIILMSMSTTGLVIGIDMFFKSKGIEAINAEIKMRALENTLNNM